MRDTIEIPAEVPVMTLDDTVLFPQAMMPLFIFEPRYRLMLEEVLANDRIFAVAGLNREETSDNIDEPPHKIAGVGMVRACRKNSDGTSNLILQGLARVECREIVSETPFRRVRIRALSSDQDGSEKNLAAMQPTLLGHLRTQIRLGAAIPDEVLQFLRQIEDPENCLDLAIFTLCPSGSLKQELLETRGILARYEKFERFLRAQIEQIKLDKKLKGELDEDDLGQN